MALEKVWEIAEVKNSRIILALDFLNPRFSIEKFVSEVADLVAGVKIGLPFLLKYGNKAIKELVKEYSDDMYLLADFKLADIPSVVKDELRRISELGFDGAITHLFQGGLYRVREITCPIDLIGVLYMSHPDAYLFEKNIECLLEEAIKGKVDGVVVGARQSKVIKLAKQRLDGVTVFSPGIGIQGGGYGEAIRNGADFEIIGRAISLSDNPREVVLRILEGERRWI